MSAPRTIRSAEVLPSQFLDYKLYFQALFLEIKAARDGYTYAKFAEDLGFKATTVMHQIVKGYRPASIRAIKSMLPHLGLPKGEEAYLLCLADFCNSQTASDKAEEFKRLQYIKQSLVPSEIDKDMLQYFSSWYHPVIWELIGVTGFNPDPDWIQQKIRVPIKANDIQDSLKLLEKLGFIAWDESRQTVSQTLTRISTGPRIKGMALVSFHKEMIQKASEALTDVSGKRRDVSSVTLKVTEERAQDLRAMIHEFQQKLLEEADKGTDGDQVYQINIQLFPFTV